MTIDFQGLMNVAAAGERNENLDMSQWSEEKYGEYHTCGTAACLIGSFCAEHPSDELMMVSEDSILVPRTKGRHSEEGSIAYRFGITIKEARWLFDGNPLRKLSTSTSKYYSAASLSGPDAIRRLRKFIYYKLRKQELMPSRDTPEGREAYDRSRNREGDRMVMDSVLEAVG